MTGIEKDLMHYDLMVQNAMRDVIRQSMVVASKTGLPSNHHFYITFLTKYPGVKIPIYLVERFPSEMTIVLQHQYYDLYVDENGFEITLSFNNMPERLSIPFASISIFADPSVNFALQFRALEVESIADAEPDLEEKDSLNALLSRTSDSAEHTGGAEIVSLDRFRKKQKIDSDKQS